MPFITFEGGEGSGKSTQARALCRHLARIAVPARLVHEPGTTPLGRRVARILKWAQNVTISPPAELLLFNVSRAELVSEVIRPALEAGEVVVCDRYADSTTAYQGYGRGLDLAMVSSVNEAGTLGVKPDLTVLIDQPVEAGMARKQGDRPDRFEKESIAFHQRVREGFLALAAQEPGRWLVVDGQQPRKQIEDIIWRRVSRLLSQP